LHLSHLFLLHCSLYELPLIEILLSELLIFKDKGLFFSHHFSETIEVQLSNKTFETLMLEVPCKNSVNQGFWIFDMQNPFQLIPLDDVGEVPILSNCGYT
jgi:hypothetical protein